MHIIRDSTYHLNEGQLLRCWQDFLLGNSDAFGQLISCYYAPLFQYGMKIHTDRAFVQDCIQDMATDLWIKRAHLSREVHVKGYLFKSLRHKMFRQLQRQQTQQQQLQRWGQDHQQPFNAEFSVESSIIDSEADQERKQQLHACLQSLSPRQQEIIYLRYYQELEHEQVAAIMKLSKVAVYNLLSAALKRVKVNWQKLSVNATGIAVLLFGKYF